jgi:glucosamine--fructose-6-phosphate aminotransferase (isomerizing)
LETNDKAKEILKLLKDAPNCLYLGRGYNFPVALEGFKAKRNILYSCEGYPAAEMSQPILL